MGLSSAQLEVLEAKGLGFLAAELIAMDTLNAQQDTDSARARGLPRGAVARQPGSACAHTARARHLLGRHSSLAAYPLRPLRPRAPPAANAMWLIVVAVLVFFMQTGFAMLCAGLVRAKNTKNILLKNVLDACVGALGFWSVGYAFSYGAADGGNPFIGNTYFFLTNFEGQDTYQSWLFQFAFAATAATIVSGAVAERTKMAAYLMYSFFLTGFVYPVVVHWVWSSAGWLSAFNASPLLGSGLVDFAGCGVVHMVGGISALCGAFVCGPRLGRYDADGKLVEIPGHSSTLQALGTFILWVGW